MKKHEKMERWGSFPAELLFFCMLAFSRFFDHKLQSHGGALPFLRSYVPALCVTLIYLAAFFCFCVFLTGRAGRERNRDMGYLTSFLAVFMAPFFLHKNYFGTSDVVVWLAVLAVATGILTQKKNGVESREAALLLVVFSACLGTGVVLGFVERDVQATVSPGQFAVMLLFFSPYIFCGARFFRGLLAGASGRQRRIYLAYALGGWLPAALWTVAGDYGRGIFYGFVCYTFPAICFLALGDEVFLSHVTEEKQKIRQILSFPAVLVFYPLIFVTFWMVGWESIPVEEILKLQ